MKDSTCLTCSDWKRRIIQAERKHDARLVSVLKGMYFNHLDDAHRTEAGALPLENLLWPGKIVVVR